MARSTNALIAQQCSIINGGVPRGGKRKFNNIIAEQLLSLNNSDSLNVYDPRVERWPSESQPVTRSERPKAPAPRPQKKASTASSKSSNSNFLQLLTGDAVSEGTASMSAQSRLRQQIAQTYVMKCLGGFKYLEGNSFDNFVVATLPRHDPLSNFKPT